MKRALIVALLLLVAAPQAFAQCQAPTAGSLPTQVNDYGNGVTLIISGSTGTAPLSFQWYIGSSPDQTTAIAGATNANVFVHPSSPTNYWVRVGNACGFANSTTVQVVPTSCPYPAPSSTISGIPAVVCRNVPVTASVPQNSDPNATYEWRFSSAFGTGSITSGDNTPTITFVADLPRHNFSRGSANVSVTVTNSCGFTSSSTVNFFGDYTPQPIINLGPGTVTSVTAGSSYTADDRNLLLTTIPPDYTFTWTVTNGVITGGQGTPSITFTAGSGPVTVRIDETNVCGSGSASVTLQQCTPPSFSQQPQDATITAGQSTQLSASASGGGGVSYQWYTGAAGDTTHPAGTGPTLTVSPPTTTQYWVRATSCSSVNSRTATVTVTQPACVSPVVTMEPADVAVAPGGKATLFVGYTGTTPVIQWYRGAAGDTSHPISGANAQTITIDPAVAGSYWARLVNSCGSADSRAATVTVNVPPSPPRHRSVRH
jgi:hypothetical protein